MEIEKFRDCIIQIRARIPENEEDCIALAKEKNMKELLDFISVQIQTVFSSNGLDLAAADDNTSELRHLMSNLVARLDNNYNWFWLFIFRENLKDLFLKDEK